MTSRPLVYENIVIGMIAQRIGECRFANRYIISPEQLVTQQVRPLEKLYRDTIIIHGSKLIVIEFKSPYVNNGVLRYMNIDIKTLISIADRLGYDNVFLALVHAYLPSYAIPQMAKNGFYLWLATPGTTAFIPLSQIVPHLKVKSYKLTIEVAKSKPPVNLSYVNVSIPSCAMQPTPIVKFEPSCASCGGLFSKLHILRKPKVSVKVNGNYLDVESYTFASLMKVFTECFVGFKTWRAGEIEEFLRHISLEATSPLALLLLSRGEVLFVSLPYRPEG